MIGAGKAVEHAIQELLPQLEKNDILIDAAILIITTACAAHKI